MAPEQRNKQGRKNPRRRRGAPAAARRRSAGGNQASSGRRSRAGRSRRPGTRTQAHAAKPSGPKPARRKKEAGRRPGPGSRGKPGRKPDRKAPHSGVGPDNLPRWMRDEVRRVTRKDRQAAALRILAEAVDAVGKDEYGTARRKLVKTKDLSPRSSAVRELLGLSAYRLEDWRQALAELRAYRRLTGDTTHMPVEMDTLRALGRGLDVEKTWARFRELGGNRPTAAEARVVYGSYLLDQGRPVEAWKVTGPTRLSQNARPYELRVWFVAARSALALGEADTARKLAAAIRRIDPDLPGLADLMSEISAGRRGR